MTKVNCQKKAHQLIKENSSALFISSITAFEISLKTRSKQLKLPINPVEWYSKVLEHHKITEIPIDGNIAHKSVELKQYHKDPCDRFIVATAVHCRLTIVTPDQHIKQYKNANVVW